MSQLQHPISDSVGTAASGPGYVSTEANYWSALDTAADGKFIDTTTDINAGAFSADFSQDVGGGLFSFITLAYNSVTDPGVNTGHKVRIRLKWHDVITADSFTELFLQFTFGGQAHNIKIASPTPGQGILPDIFSTFEFTMTSGEVDNYRANNGYNGTGNSIPIPSLVFYSDLFPPNNGSQTVTVDFLEVEVPDAGGGTEITGSGGFTLNGSASIEVPDIVGSGGILLGGSAVLVESVDISGIYEIQDGKRNDTLYVREGIDLTVDVEIPRPHYRTAFFGD